MVNSMAKSRIYLLFVLLVANIFGIGIVQAELNPNTDNLLFENSIIKIIGIDPTTYPKIKVNVHVDQLCAAMGGLVKDHFTVDEDGTNVAIDNFYFTGRASGQKLDLAVVFDETDTMADEIRAMKSNVDDLTNKIKASDIDARYSLVSFENEVMPKIEWTDDPEVFKREVNQLRAYGGFYQRPEDSLGGVAKALSFGFRPDAQKIIIVITDEPSMQRGDGWSNSTYHQDDVQQELLDAGVMLVAVSPDFRSRSIPSNIPRSDLPLYADMRELAQNSGGVWIDIYSADFSVILDQLEEIITGTYVIEYTSPTTTTSGSRTVSVSANAPECVEGIASSTYMPPASATVPNQPPVITALKSDKSSPQESGSVITWTVEAGDPDGDQVLYMFFLDDEPMTDWTTEKTWTWEAKDSGSYRIEAHVRDGKHAGPNGMDDRKMVRFEITEAINTSAITSLTNDTIIKVHTRESVSSSSYLSSALNDNGLNLFYQSRYEEAIQAFEESIRVDPYYAQPWNNIGNILVIQSKYDDSIQAFEEAISLDPKYADPWCGKGLALYNLGDYDEAIQAFDEAIRLDPGFALAWNNKGVTLAAQGKYDEAILIYDEIIGFDSENVDAWNNKGLAFGIKGEYAESLRCFEEAINRDPTDVAAWSNKGYVLELLSRTSEAKVAYAKARELGWTR